MKLYLPKHYEDDSERPMRFSFYQNYWKDVYVVHDSVTGVSVEVSNWLLLETPRRIGERDVEFLMRVVRENLETLPKQLKS